MNIQTITKPTGAKRGVVVGKRFTGKPALHIDTTTGAYYEVLPKIEGSALALQQVLLAKMPAQQPRSRVAAFFKRGA